MLQCVSYQICEIFMFSYRTCTHILPKIWEQTQNSRREKGDVKELHADDPQILKATVKYLVAWATLLTGNLRPCFGILIIINNKHLEV
jgi:ABC-type nickel/cobalt efflux system permease component RcnA